MLSSNVILCYTFLRYVVLCYAVLRCAVFRYVYLSKQPTSSSADVANQKREGAGQSRAIYTICCVSKGKIHFQGRRKIIFYSFGAVFFVFRHS